MPKIIPDAVSNLSLIVARDLAFVDKTSYLEIFEQSKSCISLFLRPRRFGKTMLTEFLLYYYDAALEPQSKKLFAGKYIATHATPGKSSYCVLKLDFCSGSATGGSEDGLTRLLAGMKSAVISGILDFYSRYPELMPDNLRSVCQEGNFCHVNDFYQNFSQPYDVLSHFLLYLDAIRNNPRRLMVIIDEYDNFANDILCRDPDKFVELTSKGSPFSSFYSLLRYYNQTGLIETVYITGILPLTLNNSLSGFVYTNITSHPAFAEVAGFTESDVEDLLNQAVDFSRCRFTVSELKEEMRQRYNGYRFVRRAGASVYNNSLCLGFIRDLILDDYQQIPVLQTFSEDDIDFARFSGYLDLIAPQDLSDLLDLLDSGDVVEARLSPAIRLTSGSDKFSFNEGATLLYHLGFLTLMTDKEALDILGVSFRASSSYLKIPNEYFRRLYANYRLARTPEVWKLISRRSWNLAPIAVKNDIANLACMLTGIAGALVNTDSSDEAESQVGLAVYVALSLSTGSSFRLTREYHVRVNSQFVFSDGLDEDEYNEVDPGEATNKGDRIREETGAGTVIATEDIGNKTVTSGSSGEGDLDRFMQADEFKHKVDLKKGRADLVAINTANGPSYLFAFKYQRDTRSRDETKIKTIRTLYSRAVRQLNFYIQDDELSKIPDMHKYAVIYAYGKFFIREAE